MDVETWLTGIGLEQYAEAFAKNGVDASLLPELTNEDLKDLGVVRLADRKRLLSAIALLSPADQDAKTEAVEQTVYEGERRQVTVMFADLAGSTELARALDAEDMHGLFDRFFEVVDRIIAGYGGSIDKHIGDCVMGVFGAPVAYGNDTQRALQAALAVRQEVPGIDVGDGRGLAVHIGVASGQVVASKSGSAGHRQYTVTGESIHLASRLTDHAAAGEILISHDIKCALADRLDCRSVGSLHVKGFPKPVPAWRLLGFGAGPGQSHWPFVGRSRELSQFDALLRSCAQLDRGQAVVLRGEAGIGKTRLLSEFKRIAEEHGFSCHAAEVLDFGTGRGQDAIRVLVRSLLELETAGEPAAAKAAASRALAEGLIVEDHTVHLYDLLDLPQPKELRALYDAMDNATRNAGKRETLAGLVWQLSARQRLLLAVEDVHWADQLTLEHLAQLTETVSDCPALLVMTSRVEGDPLDRQWRSSTSGAALLTIDLGPLTRSDALLLAKAFPESAARVAELCVDRAAGNPLFLEQLLQEPQRDIEVAIPGSIQSLVQASMDRLKGVDKRALQAASVLGQRFSPTRLRYLLQMPDYDCGPLVSRFLVRPSGEGFLFSHALVRDVVYDSQLKAQRQELHRRAAESYLRADPVLRAEHLDRAESEEAAMAYVEAAEAEIAAFRLQRALALVDRAQSLARSVQEQLRAGLLRAELIRELGRIREAKDAFHALVDVAPEDVGTCRAWIGIASCVRLLGGYDEGIEALANAEALISRDGELFRELSQVAYYRGCLLFSAGDIDGCLAQHERARAHAVRANDPEWEARALSGLGDAHYGRGRMRRSLEQFRRCAELCQRGGNGKIEAGSIHMSGLIRRYLNEFREGIKDLRNAAILAGKVGNARTEMIALTILGELLVDAGELQAAYSEFKRALTICDRLGNRLYRAYILYQLGRALWHDGQRRGEAEATLRNALALSRDTKVTFVGPRILAALALATDTGDSSWRELLDEGEAILRFGCLAHNVLWFYRDASEAALIAGDWDRSNRYAEALEVYTAAEPLPWADYFIARSRALAAFGRGQRDAATIKDLKRLYDEGERQGMTAALPRLQHALASV